MEPSVLAKIAIRIIALYLVAQGILQTVYIIQMIFLPLGADITPMMIILACLFAIVIPLGFALFLWLCSNKLSSWVVGKRNKVTEESGISSHQLQSIIFSSIGLIIIFTMLPDLISQLTSAYRMSQDNNQFISALAMNIGGFTGTVLQLLFGILLVLGASFWSNLWHRFKGFGLKKKL